MRSLIPFHPNRFVPPIIPWKSIAKAFNILVFISFTYYFLLRKYYSIKNNQNINALKNIENPYTSFIFQKYTYSLNLSEIHKISENIKNTRYLLTLFYGSYNKQDYLKRKQVQNIIKKLISSKYTAKWYSTKKNFKIGDSPYGKARIQLAKAIEFFTKEESMALMMTNYEDKYINNWIHHTSFSIIKNLNFFLNKEEQKFIISGKWDTAFQIGSYFKSKLPKQYTCNSTIELNIPIINKTFLTTMSNGYSFIENITSIDNTKFNIIFNSDCGFNMTLEVFEDKQEEEYENNRRINKYCIILSVILIIFMISYHLMINSLIKNRGAIECISTATLSQNLNWHFYCSMTHISWCTNNNYRYPQFGFIALLYSLIFFINDTRLMRNFFLIKGDTMSPRKLIDLKVKFYLSFYLSFFVSFFFISDFMLYYFFISISLINVWTPQIIYNIFYKNKIIYPFFYLILNTIERCFYGIYFRCYNGNFYRIRGSEIFLRIIIIFFAIQIIFLYLQVFKGPRFFMKNQNNSFNFYKTKDELLAFSNNVVNMECVICLSPIFNVVEMSNIYKENENNNNNNNNNSIISASNSENNIMKKENQSKDAVIPIDRNNDILSIKKNKIKKIKIKSDNEWKFFIGIKNIIKILFCEGFIKFYKVSKNIMNKKYMMTPCHHCFHTECLEAWIERKKECPSCRADLTEALS